MLGGCLAGEKMKKKMREREKWERGGAESFSSLFLID